MARNMNVTTTKETEADIESQMRKMSSDMQRVFAESPVCTIKIFKEKDDKETSVEGGINGYFFTLKKGTNIPDVPRPILDTLDEAGIQYSRIGDLRPSTAMLAKQQANAAAEQKRLDKDREKAEKEAARLASQNPPA